MAAKDNYPMLVIDAGNTSVKFARVSRAGGTPRVLRSIPTARLTTTSVTAIVRRSACRAVVASCVVPAARKILRAGCRSTVFIGKSTPLNFPTKVGRGTVGADRLADMAQAARRFGRSVVVADFGTAATFDLLDARGCFAGGAIAPGWHALSNALARAASQLPAVDARPPRAFAGRNTREALRAGMAGGYGGMVRHLLRQLPARHVVFTGGDAAVAAKLTGLKVTIDPLWTLRGIAVLGGLDAREASK